MELFQARILEWVAISISFWPRDWNFYSLLPWQTDSLPLGPLDGLDLTKILCAKQMEVLWVPADLISFLCVLSKKKSHWTKVNWQGMRLKHCNHESQSRSVMPDPLWPHGLCSPWHSSGQNTGVGSVSLLQGIFPTQGSNPGFPHCTWILYQLSHQESPIMLQSWGEAKPSFSYTSRK